MAMFTVRRHLGDVTKDDVDAAAFRAIVCAFEYPGMVWHESYWDVERGDLICIYEAETAEQILNHAERSKIPCDEVRPVVVVRPGDYDLGRLLGPSASGQLTPGSSRNDGESGAREADPVIVR